MFTKFDRSGFMDSKCDQLPVTPFGCKYRRNVVHLDSRSRESPTTTTPSAYTIYFPPVANVKQLRLISADLPASGFIVNASNNIFHVVDGVTTYVITIPQGNYTAATFATQLDTLTTTATGVAITITVDATNGKLTFNPASELKLNFVNVSNSAHSLIGFARSLYTLTAVTNTAAPFPPNLDGDRYVLMLAENCPALKCPETSKAVLARITFPREQCSAFDDMVVANTCVFPSTKRLERLVVEFRRQDGSLYDFNGREHSYAIEVWEEI